MRPGALRGGILCDSHSNPEMLCPPRPPKEAGDFLKRELVYLESLLCTEQHLFATITLAHFDLLKRTSLRRLSFSNGAPVFGHVYCMSLQNSLIRRRPTLGAWILWRSEPSIRVPYHVMWYELQCKTCQRRRGHGRIYDLSDGQMCLTLR